MAVGDDTATDALEEVSDAIHALAQPLTALSFVVDMALLQNSPEAWKTALEHARAETRRAFAALDRVRDAAAAMHVDKDSPWEQLQ